MRLRKIGKPLSFVPAVLVMCMIFYFSAQTGEESSRVSLKVSRYLVGSTDKYFAFGMDSERLEEIVGLIHTAVRKLGHVTEYFVLAVTVSFPLYVYGLKRKRLFLSVGGFCTAFAALDEFHQSFVADRGPSVRDVGVDCIGILIGMILVGIVCRIKQGKHSG